MEEEIIEGEVRFEAKFWDDDEDSHWSVGGTNINWILSDDRFKGKKVRVTIEVIEEEK